MEELPKLTKKQGLEMLIATLSMLAIMAFFVMIAIVMMSGCSHINFRLPDRNHPNCSIPWDQRPTCISSADCGLDYECAKRGSVIGKCTYIDCCEPWRHGPKLLNGASWCADVKFDVEE